MTTEEEAAELADLTKAARHLEDLFGGRAANEALRRATNAGRPRCNGNVWRNT